jgi:hypothetical protein
MLKPIIHILILSLLTVPFCNISQARTIRLDKDQSMLNISERLVLKGTENDPVTIIIPNPVNDYIITSIHDRTMIKTDKNLKELEIYPYKVDTEEGLEELRAFRYQYLFVWSVLMGICFYLVLNRTAYW